MTWYAAHIVMQIASANEERIVAWENIVLIEADDTAQAFANADSHGYASEGDSDGTMTWEGVPARFVYRGTRRLVSLSNPTDIYNAPSNGCELTYLQINLPSEQALQDFLDGDGSAELCE